MPFVKTIDKYVFIKDIIGKVNCDLHMRFFFEKTKQFLTRTISATQKKRGEKDYFKKWMVARRPQSNY